MKVSKIKSKVGPKVSKLKKVKKAQVGRFSNNLCLKKEFWGKNFSGI